MKKFPKKLLPIAVLSSIAFSSLASGSVPEASAQEKKKGNQDEIKNVIVLIGDGMGVSYTSAHRYLKDNKKTKFVAPTTFDQYLVGQQTTYPEDPEQNVTDSASAATAMSAGIKHITMRLQWITMVQKPKQYLKRQKRKENQQDLWPLQKLHTPLRPLSVHTITAEKI